MKSKSNRSRRSRSPNKSFAGRHQRRLRPQGAEVKEVTPSAHPARMPQVAPTPVEIVRDMHKCIEAAVSELQTQIQRFQNLEDFLARLESEPKPQEHVPYVQ